MTVCDVDGATMTENLCVSPRCRTYGAHRAGGCREGCTGCAPRPATVGLLCRACADNAGRDAIAAAELHAELAQDLVVAGSGSGSGVNPFPGIDLDSAVAGHRMRIKSELATLCRLIAEEAGYEQPEPGWRIIPLSRGVHGPARKIAILELGIGYLGAWLNLHRGWLAAHPAAGEHCATLEALVHTGHRRQEQARIAVIELGPCPRCTGTLTAVVRRDNPIPSEVACNGEERHAWAGERRLAELGREVGVRDGWLSARDVARRYGRPIGTVHWLASQHRWRRTEDGQRPVLYHPADVEATVQSTNEAAA